MRIEDQDPYSRFNSLVHRVANSGQRIVDIVEDLRSFVLIYALSALAIITIGWLINITGNRMWLPVLVLASITGNAIVVLKPSFAIPATIGALLYEASIADEDFINLLPETLDAFTKLLCSVIYSAVWPLLLLTRVSFANNPGGFWQIYAAVLMIAIAVLHMKTTQDSSAPGTFEKLTSALVRAVFVATPRKLFIQFLLAIAANLSLVLGGT